MAARTAWARAALSLWVPVALYAVGVACLSHQPTLGVPVGLPDWLWHAAEFGGLAALVVRALGGWPGGMALPAGALALAGCTAFGVLDEAHQAYVPGRHASVRDVAADAAGSALVIGAALLRHRRHRRAVAAPIEVTLYGRPGCALCDEAEALLEQASRRHPIRVSKVDVDADPGLARRYGHEVPVVEIAGRRWSKLRLDAARLHRKLRSLEGRSR